MFEGVSKTNPMRKALLALFFIFTSLSIVSCEDVVHVDLSTAEPRLVVDASIDWHKGTNGNLQRVILTKTAGYYDGQIPMAAGATVWITNDKGNFFEFIEYDDPGVYWCDNFLPEIGITYRLTIQYENQSYYAEETMLAVPDLVGADQEAGTLVDDFLIVKGYFNDPANETNFYMHRFIRDGKGSKSAVFDDEFVNGNLTYTVRFFDDLVAGDNIEIQLMGISSQYYDYMNKIYGTISEGNTGPFEVPPADIRGNIVNTGNRDDNAYGYFRLSEVSSIQYTVQ